MKYEIIATIVIVLFSYLFGFTQEANLTVQINGISSSKGKLMVGIFNNETDFKSKTNPVYKASISPIDSLESYTFISMPNGTYAIAVYHDANENGALDKKKLGIPSEGVGFSGRQSKGIKPPHFKEISFHFSNDTVVMIPLKYPKNSGD